MEELRADNLFKIWNTQHNTTQRFSVLGSGRTSSSGLKGGWRTADTPSIQFLKICKEMPFQMQGIPTS